MQSRAAWAGGSSEPEQNIIAGDRIAVFIYARFRLKDSNEWQQIKLADVCSVREGRVVQMNAFADRQQALLRAGQPGPATPGRHTFEPTDYASHSNHNNQTKTESR
jgi:hypothetical protein